MSTSLSLVSVEKVFAGDVVAVAGVSLDVAPGEFVTLLGPSGSGKTTLLKMIAGFETPTAGDIRLDDTSVVRLPAYRREIGMVFQNYALFPHLTVRDNVAFPLSVRNVPRPEVLAKTHSALDLVHLGEFANRYPGQLSGGQQQRVALARAVVFGPKILLMDEPLGALDKNLREHMKTEIIRIQKSLNMTVIYVTHDQDEALTMSDRIAVMRDGQLVQVAGDRELYSRPANKFVAEFIGESNFLPCTAGDDGEGSGWVTLENGMRVRASIGATAPRWLMIRPERISMEPAGSGTQTHVLEGMVTEAMFLGETTRYSVTAMGLDLTVKCQNHDETCIAPGTQVSLNWKPEHAIALD